jgi:pimeloyl-ACP methyl ester carboxylesterase
MSANRRDWGDERPELYLHADSLNPVSTPIDVPDDLEAQLHASESLFMADSQLVALRPPVPEQKVHEVEGSIRVGAGETDFKGFFPEIRLPGWAIVSPGYGGFLKSSEALGKALAAAGLANLIYDPLRGYNNSVCEDFTHPQRLHIKTIEQLALQVPRNPDIQRQAPEAKQIFQEKKIMVAHSMGGLAVPAFAELHPEEVEMIGMLETVGVNKSILWQIMKSMGNGDALTAYTKDLLPYLTSGEIELSWKNAVRAGRYFGLGIPGPKTARPSRAIGEALSCLFGNVRPSLRHLGELGVRRLFVSGGRDILVQAAPDIMEYYDMCLLLDKYGHLLPQRRARVAAQVIVDARTASAAAA